MSVVVDHVIGRPRLRPQPLVWFPLRPADSPLVAEGEEVTPGASLLERVRDAAAVEIALPSAARAPAPGTRVTGRRGRRREAHGGEGTPGAVLGELEDDLVRRAVTAAVAPEAVGRVLYEGTRRRLRVAVGRHVETVSVPMPGRVESIEPSRIGVRANGEAIPGAFAAGEPTSGRLVLAVDRPDAELRAAAIDVSANGAILVGGARVDAEVLTRARAMGVRGIVTGGLMGRDLRTYLASEARQRAALHAAPPFGLVVLDGYGKRPFPSPLWRCLAAAEGREVALTMDPALVVLPAGTPLPAPDPDAVWVRSGDQLGREGRLLEVLGPERHAAGVYQPSARVLLLGDERRPEEERVIPLADLERFE